MKKIGEFKFREKILIRIFYNEINQDFHCVIGQISTWFPFTMRRDNIMWNITEIVTQSESIAELKEKTKRYCYPNGYHFEWEV